MKVTLVSTGAPLRPGTWSGSPLGLARALARRGVSVAGVDAAPPAALRVTQLAASLMRTRSRLDAGYDDLAFALRSWTARQRLGRADGVVLLGAECALPSGTRYVVWSDMTLPQARRHHPVFARLSERTAAAWTARQRRVLQAAHAVAAGSEWTADSLRDDLGVDPGRIYVVGFGRNHEPVPSPARDWAAPRFLFIGREWERKDGPAVVRAFRRVRASSPQARLDVVGEHPPLDEPGVVGHGPLQLGVPEEAAVVRDLLGRATCVVLPSACEPFGIVHAEALAAGAPSIGTTVGGPRSIIGDAGLVVDPGDDEALTAAMLRLADPDEARRRGAAALGRAPAFTWDAVAGRMLDALSL